MPFDKALASSEVDTWETPQEFFEPLQREFGIDLDVCANASNAKCAKFFSLADDGLSQNWEGHVCWMNPPYGRVIRDWVKKASEEKALVVCLVPARTDTAWWQDYVMPRAKEIRFLRGRLKFVGAKYSAPFPAAVVIFDGRELCGIGTSEGNVTPVFTTLKAA